MTTPIQMYRSTNGTLHETEHASLRADLCHMLVESGAVNAASADKLVEWMCEPRETLNVVDGLIGRLYDTHLDAPNGMMVHRCEVLSPAQVAQAMQRFERDGL